MLDLSRLERADHPRDQMFFGFCFFFLFWYFLALMFINGVLECFGCFGPYVHFLTDDFGWIFITYSQ